MRNTKDRIKGGKASHHLPSDKTSFPEAPPAMPAPKTDSGSAHPEAMSVLEVKDLVPAQKHRKLDSGLSHPLDNLSAVPELPDVSPFTSKSACVFHADKSIGTETPYL
jgi:hypothetical protein